MVAHGGETHWSWEAKNAGAKLQVLHEESCRTAFFRHQRMRCVACQRALTHWTGRNVSPSLELTMASASEETDSDLKVATCIGCGPLALIQQGTSHQTGAFRFGRYVLAQKQRQRQLVDSCTDSDQQQEQAEEEDRGLERQADRLVAWCARNRHRQTNLAALLLRVVASELSWMGDGAWLRRIRDAFCGLAIVGQIRVRVRVRVSLSSPAIASRVAAVMRAAEMVGGYHLATSTTSVMFTL